ncbi:BTB/POZ domain-containing protein 3-like [Lutzomyia longipalpis]|uniref:BTB/POZ domain-containing protein 3-like n=1 Tax=Lutzomyia longipalpis TaxID=7200 RepID=UPI0024836C6E|nr:BTB/POZ domain-containing protein 3-like [Lutzomyia longipalpis]
MTNWRDEFATPGERLASLKCKSILSDMTFIVGPDETHIPGHRFVLSLVSPTFESCDKEIRIADFQVGVFMEFLDYIYSGEVTLSDGTVLEILKLAHRYSINFLVRDCVNFLRRNIKVANVLLCLELGINLDVKDLTFECLDVIADFTLAVMQQEAFLAITRETLRHILELEITICTEYEIFQGAMRWAEAECNRQNIESNNENKREVLGDLMDLIRFTAIESDYEDELCNMMQQFSAKATTKTRSLSSALPTFFDYGHVKLTILTPLDRIHLTPETVRDCSLELRSNQVLSIFGFGVIVETGVELTGHAEMSYFYDGVWVDLKKEVNVSVGCRWKFGAKHEIVFLLLKEKLTMALSNYIYRIILHNQAASLTQVLGDKFNETMPIISSSEGEDGTIIFDRHDGNYIPMILVQQQKFT